MLAEHVRRRHSGSFVLSVNAKSTSYEVPMLSTGKRLLLLIGVGSALYYASQNYTLTGLKQLRIESIKATDSSSQHPSDSNATGWEVLEASLGSPKSDIRPGVAKAVSARSTIEQTHVNEVPKIRVASFNLHSFNESKLKKQPVVETLARIVRHFDVIAVQHLDARQSGLLPTLVERINMSDRRYDYCIGPRVGSEGQSQQFAFLFDTARIETDREQLYTLEDPQNLIQYDPLVGWFRVKGVRTESAFTFSLVNIRLDPADAEKERQLLPEIVRSIRQDGRQEDDIILLGDFSSSSRQLGRVDNLNMTMALEEVATTVSGEYMLDNILFLPRATDEFTGRAGVIDFLRQLNLSYDQAMQVSSHLPVWAEFYAHEGAEER